MKPNDCQNTRAMLVEYADQELNLNDTELVQRHLESCLACREALVRLETSIELCHEIWKESDEFVPQVKASCSTSHVKTSLTRAVVVLAVTLLLAVSLWPLLGHNDAFNANAAKSKPDKPSQDSTTTADIETSSDHLPIDVQQTISRATMAARLEASSAALATDPALAEYRERADRLLATTFADLEAGQRAKLRLDSNDHSYQ